MADAHSVFVATSCGGGILIMVAKPGRARPTPAPSAAGFAALQLQLASKFSMQLLR
eukprot:SAG11_NODE_203_length_12529_cov_6.036444_5_plen_56_part_00